MIKKIAAITLILSLSSCISFKKKKSLRDMNYQELKEHKTLVSAQKDTDAAIKYLEKMLPLCQNPLELRTDMIELADLLFNAGKLNQAEKIYRDYSKQFPGDEQSEYSLYKAILCSFYKSLDSSRDQTKTEETIKLVEQFVEQEMSSEQYLQEVKKIGDACTQKLIETNVAIISFYIQQGRLRSAQHRINTTRKQFGTTHPFIEADLLYAEYQIALAQQNNVGAEEKKRMLIEQFADHPHTVACAQQSSRKSLLSRL